MRLKPRAVVASLLLFAAAACSSSSNSTPTGTLVDGWVAPVLPGDLISFDDAAFDGQLRWDDASQCLLLDSSFLEVERLLLPLWPEGVTIEPDAREVTLDNGLSFTEGTWVRFFGGSALPVDSERFASALPQLRSLVVEERCGVSEAILPAGSDFILDASDDYEDRPDPATPGAMPDDQSTATLGVTESSGSPCLQWDLHEPEYWEIDLLTRPTAWVEFTDVEHVDSADPRATNSTRNVRLVDAVALRGEDAEPFVTGEVQLNPYLVDLLPELKAKGLVRLIAPASIRSVDRLVMTVQFAEWENGMVSLLHLCGPASEIEEDVVAYTGGDLASAGAVMLSLMGLPGTDPAVGDAFLNRPIVEPPTWGERDPRNRSSLDGDIPDEVWERLGKADIVLILPDHWTRTPSADVICTWSTEGWNACVGADFPLGPNEPGILLPVAFVPGEPLELAIVINGRFDDGWVTLGTVETASLTNLDPLEGPAVTIVTDATMEDLVAAPEVTDLVEVVVGEPISIGSG